MSQDDREPIGRKGRASGRKPPLPQATRRRSRKDDYEEEDDVYQDDIDEEDDEYDMRTR